jgi:hypothetical protein
MVLLSAAPGDVAGMAGPTLAEHDVGAVHRIMRRSELLNGDPESPLRRTRLSWATTGDLMVRRAAILHCSCGVPT